jgi:hypothetical protein
MNGLLLAIKLSDTKLLQVAFDEAYYLVTEKF